MGRKCAVEGCLSDSNRPEDTGVTFHKVPMHSDIRPKWISLCRIPIDKKSTKVIYICSRHFLRVDFCNFKGRKYMLRQGVLPSVFPWDKSKLEAIKVSGQLDSTTDAAVKEEPASSDYYKDSTVDVKPEIKQEMPDIFVQSCSEVVKTEEVKQEEIKDKRKPTNSNGGPINFSINSRIEALDFNNTWYPARIVEEDYEENEVLIHFEKYSSKYDEWISMDSPRLRPVQAAAMAMPSTPLVKKNNEEQFSVGERCLATWSDARKFPATVTRILPNDMYEVLFDDGFVKNLKSHRMCKGEGRPIQSSPLFDPILSSKAERREKKRKIDIAALFGKRPRLDHTAEEKHEKPAKAITHSSPQVHTCEPAYHGEVCEPWVPQWENGKPVGKESVIELTDGTRKSYIVPDPRLPPGWVKHLAQRMHGASAGKWDTVIISPDNRRFRSRADIKSYIEDNTTLNYHPSMFDFSIHRQRNRRKEPDYEPVHKSAQDVPCALASTSTLEEQPDQSESIPEEEENTNSLKIPLVDDAYQCPIEGCGKNYRKENLAQMHVKHYHPEYTKFLDSTPNVADLAYARTVGESLDKSPTHVKKAFASSSTPKIATTKSTTKLTQSPQIESDAKPQSPMPSKYKDSEIIKLLNTKPCDGKKDSDFVNPLSSGLPSSVYPDIKLGDLLSKSEHVPSRDELNLRALNTTRPSTGIKTLLPVIRSENKTQSSQDYDSPYNKIKSNVKRKRALGEPVDSPKGNNESQDITHTPQEPPPLSEPNNIIIEGGQVIKIVRMKQEEIINCTCGYPEEDGLMIQCDLCLCWQHAFCNNIERESQVPEKYVCYICQNPAKQRVSKKYFHDQDWLKNGTLATASFHTRDEDALVKRFEKLKKSHDISGGLLELKDFVHTLRVKLKIAEAKNHPKLYLWSKPWEKSPLPEKPSIKEDDIKLKTETDDPAIKMEDDKNEQADSMLMMILKGAKDDKNDLNMIENLQPLPPAPIIPQPEAAINSADCRLNLLEHISHSQSLVEERLDDFEKQIDAIEDLGYEEDENYPRTRHSLNMLLKDLNTLQELSQITMI